MRIFYIINGRFPTEKANGYQIAQMCQSFEENGTRTFLLRPQRISPEKIEAFKDKPEVFYSLKRKLSVIDVKSYDFQHALNKISPIFRKVEFFTNILHTITFAMGILKFFRDYNVQKDDLIYIRDVNLYSILKKFLPKKLKKKIVVELHYLPQGKFKRIRYIKILRDAFALVCITTKMKSDVVAMGYDPSKVIVEHDGVDLSVFGSTQTIEEAREKLKFPQGIKIIGYVGNFHTNNIEKGIDDLIFCSRFVFDKNPNVFFYFVGGPLDRVPKYRKIIAENNLPEKQFVFLDRVPVKEVPVVLAACDIVTIPLPWNPYFAFYMSPMKLFEYMSSLRPIVATNVESLSEILTDGKNAFLCQHADMRSMANAILKVFDDENSAKKIAQQARADVENHTWLKRSQRILTFVKGISE